MADTKHAPADIPVEGDGVSYRGIVWFIVVLAATVDTIFARAVPGGADHTTLQATGRAVPQVVL